MVESSVFVKGFGDFHKKKHDKSAPKKITKKNTQKNVFNFKIPGFSQKKTFLAPKSPFFAQNPGIFTKKNAGRFAAGFSQKKITKKNGASRRFFTKKKRYSFCFVKIACFSNDMLQCHG